jgi:hypothetical protein
VLGDRKRRKMAKTKRAKAKSAAPYVRRLLGDEYVREHLGHAAARLQEAYRRVARQRGKAAEDKKLYGNLREAATSIRKATLALQRRRAEPKRSGRKVLIVALAGGGAAVLLSGSGRAKLLGAFSGKPGASGDGGEATMPVRTETSSSHQQEPTIPTTS